MTLGTRNNGFAGRLSKVEESSTMRVMIAAHKLKSEGADVIDLGAGEPDFDTPAHIKAAAKAAIDANFTRYTPAGGTAELRDAVVSRFLQDFGVERGRDEVVITVGGKHSTFNILFALVETGDEVLIPSPYWVTFPQIVHLCGGEPVIVPVSAESGFQVTADMLRPHLTARTRVVILNSPNNPSGAVIPYPEFLRICELAADHGAYVLSDECYQQLVYDGVPPYTGAALPESLRRRVVVSGSLSKTYAMTGWRIGYTIGPEDLVRKLVALQSHETSNPTSIAQAAAVEALTGPQAPVLEMRAAYQARRDYLVGALGKIPGIQCPAPGGAFYVFPDIRAHLSPAVPGSEQFAARLLSEAHVAVTPGIAFGSEGHLRLSYTAAKPDLEKAVDRLDRFVRQL